MEARDRIIKLVHGDPLRDYPAAMLAEAYAPGRRKAEAEKMALRQATEACPWTIDLVLDHVYGRPSKYRSCTKWAAGGP